MQTVSLKDSALLKYFLVLYVMSPLVLSPLYQKALSQSLMTAQRHLSIPLLVLYGLMCSMNGQGRFRRMKGQ
jgi:hypothetical protein